MWKLVKNWLQQWTESDATLKHYGTLAWTPAEPLPGPCPNPNPNPCQNHSPNFCPTLSQTLTQTLAWILVQTFAGSPAQTLAWTLALTHAWTLAWILAQTIAWTVAHTLAKTLAQTLAQTLAHTFTQTLAQTLDQTLAQTLAKMENSIIESDWLFPHHPIPNAKFPAITALLNRSTYHNSAKGSPTPCSQIWWTPKLMNKPILSNGLWLCVRHQKSW